MSLSPPSSRTNSVSSTTIPMVDFKAPIPEHRKHIFTASGNSPSWPTPPAETEHDFPAQESNGQDKNLISDKQEVQESIAKAIQSPPASPKDETWNTQLAPLHSPPDAPARTLLPSIADRELFSEPSANNALPLFPKPAEDRADNNSTSEKPVNKSLYMMFPQFRGMETSDLKRYLDECYRELKSMPGFRPVNPPMSHARIPTYSPPRPTRITKPKSVHVPAKVTLAKVKAQRPPAVNTSRDSASPVPVRTPKTPVRVREQKSQSVEPQARKRAAPSKVVVSENWQSLPDYSPPTSTLDSMPLRLKVHWKGAPNDLSTDPEVSYLHPQEVEIAQDLKLPAAQYLSNKRRIFEARLKSIRERKNFTKTAAQQACNIDVNKTSQMYEAYERVGWFDESVFSKWLT